MVNYKIQIFFYRLLSVKTIAFWFLLNPFYSILQAQPTVNYSFIVAGHAYGAHSTQSNGLHPVFLNSLNQGFDTTVRFFVLTGDIVNNSTTESWQQVEQELANYNLPAYYVMGNHDYNETGIAIFEDKFGSTYYSFDNNHERFIVLNSIEADRAISTTQLGFLDQQLRTAGDTIENIFIFFHEVIWNSHQKYKDVLSNSRSRYAQMVDYSNYWQEVHPMLENYPDKKIVVIAGDVGGNPDAIAAFYDKWNNITLLSSGMGEVEDENYLLVSVLTDGTVTYKPVALNNQITMRQMDYYSIPQTTQFENANEIVLINCSYNYSVSNVFNADAYEWKLPKNTKGSSQTNSIDVQFDSTYIAGYITVSATKSKFGKSAPDSLFVTSLGTGQLLETCKILDFYSCLNSGNNWLKISGTLNYHLTLLITDLGGRKVYASTIRPDCSGEALVKMPNLKPSIYIVTVENKNQKQSKKIIFQ